jgi:hypothetical protein
VLAIPLATSLAPGEMLELRLEFRGEAAHVTTGFATAAEYGLLTRSHEVLTLTGFYPILAPYTEAGWALDPVGAVGDALFADAASYDVSLVVTPDVTVARPADRSSSRPTAAVYWSSPGRRCGLSPGVGRRRAPSAGDIRRRDCPSELVSAAPCRSCRRRSSALRRSMSTRLSSARSLMGPSIVEAPCACRGRRVLGPLLRRGAQRRESARSVRRDRVPQAGAPMVSTRPSATPTEEPWLDEALATYASNVFLRRRLLRSGAAMSELVRCLRPRPARTNLRDVEPGLRVPGFGYVLGLRLLPGRGRTGRAASAGGGRRVLRRARRVLRARRWATSRREPISTTHSGAPATAGRQASCGRYSFARAPGGTSGPGACMLRVMVQTRRRQT